MIRSLEIIGEAAGHVPREVRARYPEVPWALIKDFRNILAHEYFGVDSEIVWQTIHKNLFELKSTFVKILSES